MGTKEIEKKMNLYKTFVIKKMRAQVIFYISSCRKFTSIMSEQMLINMDKFLPYGMPRNDLFFSSLLDKNIIKNKMGVDISTSIILYAPTYRGSFRNCNFTVSNISIPDVISAATTRFNKKFVFLYKAHHVMKDIDKNKDLGINVTSYPDMQELLYISDILITDYSSSIWDFSFTYKPCFLYAPDLENYKIEFGFYTPIETWPFPLAQSNMELKEKILTFDDEKYHENVVKHHKDLGSYENGTATETIVKKILSYIK
jgi:CDP-glycerol glycerophosphotransferase